MRTLLLALAALAAAGSARAGEAVFDMTLYIDGRPAAEPGLYSNPILPGFYPDPSIERVGDDYYLINSSFAFWPGIPVWHSTDLVHWNQIGNAIDRPGMLDFSGLGTSRGVFAPELSYHDGTFYIINTCVDCGGNFVISARNPAGPWSDPAWLPFDGIDPALFWDDDGHAYVVNNGPPEEKPLYDGHRAIWIQAFDPATKTLSGPRKVIVDGGTDIAKKPVWIEGPHLFKKDSHYYLMCAEGGTAENHSEVIFRADSVWGPYVPWSGNPILTQRDLDPARPNPVTSSGHADLVQTQAGDWWAVFLATRPYQDGLYNTGRETFMLPVGWQDGWPLILPHGVAIPAALPAPDLGSNTQAAPDGVSLSPNLYLGHALTAGDPHQVQIRSPKDAFATFTDLKTLVLKPLAEPIGDVNSHPAFLGRRQVAATETVRTTLTYVPDKEGDRAGLVAVQNDNFYYFFGISMRDGKPVVEVTRRAGAQDPRDGVLVASAPLKKLAGKPLHLALKISNGIMSFDYGTELSGTLTLAQNVDATVLSTAKAGGFVGTIVGPYAYSATTPVP